MVAARYDGASLMLTDTQTIVLSRAAQNDRLALPLPDHLRAGAAHKVVGALLRKGFLEEVEAARDTPVWRETEDDHGVTLRITDAGLEAIGIEPEPAGAATPESTRSAPESAQAVADQKPGEDAASSDEAVAPKRRSTRSGTKQATLVDLLSRPEGATIEQMVETTGWRSHTVRGAMAGALKKKLGLTITSEKVDGTRVYRINS